MKKILLLFVLMLSLVLCLVSCGGTNDNDDSDPADGNKDSENSESAEAEKYADALELIAEGKYVEAYEILSELGDYQDAEELLENFYYVPVTSLDEFDDERFTAEIFYDEDNLPLHADIVDAEGNKYTIEIGRAHV